MRGWIKKMWIALMGEQPIKEALPKRVEDSLEEIRSAARHNIEAAQCERRSYQVLDEVVRIIKGHAQNGRHVHH